MFKELTWKCLRVIYICNIKGILCTPLSHPYFKSLFAHFCEINHSTFTCFACSRETWPRWYQLVNTERELISNAPGCLLLPRRAADAQNDVSSVFSEWNRESCFLLLCTIWLYKQLASVWIAPRLALLPLSHVVKGGTAPTAGHLFCGKRVFSPSHNKEASA